MTYAYNGMGLLKSLSSSALGTIIDSGLYDAAGRLTAYRMTRGTDLYRQQIYYPWTGSTGSSNGRLQEIRVGTTNGGSNRLRLQYTGYDSVGNLTQTQEQWNNGTTYTQNFTYDQQNRILSGFNKSYTWHDSGNFQTFEGATYTYDGATSHGVQRINGADRYDYDANGNITVRNKGLGSQQSLAWNHENRLSSVSGSGVNESYLYDDGGQRVRKTNGGDRVYYPFAHYEQETGSSPDVVKYYLFNGQRVMMHNSATGTSTYLHADHLGSTTLLTNQSGAQITSQSYFAFGEQRGGGSLSTDRQYTGQQKDSSGLYYYNARYYDPTLGQFLSPDTIVPDPEKVFDYNRYMYVRGNALKYTDPTGHIAVCFKGGAGNTGTYANVGEYLEHCQNSLRGAGYEGEILPMYNGVSAIEEAYERIREAKSANPNEPVLIVGYSWGGAASLDLAHVLNGEVMTSRGSRKRNPSIDVDLLFLIDPEENFRGFAQTFMGKDSRRTQTYVPSNVKSAVNVFAGDAAQDGEPVNIPLPFGQSIETSIPFVEVSPQNGMNNVRGALNVELSALNTGHPVTHISIRSIPQTYMLLRIYAEKSLQ